MKNTKSVDGIMVSVGGAFGSIGDWDSKCPHPSALMGEARENARAACEGGDYKGHAAALSEALECALLQAGATKQDINFARHLGLLDGANCPRGTLEAWDRVENQAAVYAANSVDF